MQKAGIQVDEEGSVVYVATEAGIGNKIGSRGPREFIANRPFLFFIQDETTGALLFAGKIENPSDIAIQH